MKLRLSILLVSLLAALAVSMPAFSQTQSVAVRFDDAFSNVPQASAGLHIGIPSDGAEVGAPLTAAVVSDAFLSGSESGREQNWNANLVGASPTISNAAEFSWASVSNPDPISSLALSSVGQVSVGGPRPDAVLMNNPSPDALRAAPEPSSVVLLVWGTLALAVGSLVTKKVPSRRIRLD